MIHGMDDEPTLTPETSPHRHLLESSDSTARGALLKLN
jgi:hypothetical protein